MSNFQDIVPTEIVNMANRFVSAGGRFFIVGGFVRDFFMGVNAEDIDVMVSDMTIPKFEKHVMNVEG